MAASETDLRPKLFPVALVVITNIMMLINQLNIPSIYVLIASDFRQSVTGLGLLTASYFLAYGLFIVPGGIIAAKVGPRRTEVTGALLSSFVILASALSPNFVSLLVLRFLAGLGFALVFPSSLILNVRYFGNRAVGVPMGLTAVAFSIGGTAAFFGWPVLGTLVGWRTSVLIAGVLALIPSAMLTLLPREEPLPEFSMTRRALSAVVFSRPIVILTVMLLGVGATYALTNNFMVYYLEKQFGASPGFAGFVTGLNSIVQLFAGLGVGRVYDRARNIRALLIGMAFVLSFGVSLAALGSIPAAVVSVILCGTGASGAFVAAYSATRNAVAFLPGYHSLALAWVNSFNFFGQVISPIYFSLIVEAHGFSTAWLLGGSVAAILALPLLGFQAAAENESRSPAQ